MPVTAAVQPSLEDFGTHLSQVTFVVVDLETTGSGPDAEITEIGAVKVRGGVIEGEYQTLVNPGLHIPANIAVLTGITDAMVAPWPRIEALLPSFLEFARGAVIVAHNARFDVGFLRRACDKHGFSWPSPIVIDTVALARQVMLRDEVPNVKLGTLAAYFHTQIEPNHRALSDARATVDVLHHLLERVGNRGVNTLEDLREHLHKVSPQRRAKRGWAKELPEAPGVYSFVSTGLGDGERHVLYVGKSKNLRRRVAQYFTASETRPRMEEMVRIATAVEHIVCATALEAEVRELRLIAAHAPRYNRRSKFPAKELWLKVTAEPYPRLSLVRESRDDGATYFGPFTSRSSAEQVQLALYDAFTVRQCTKRLSPRRPTSDCTLAELGRCPAPCRHAVSQEDYQAVVDNLRHALMADVRPVVDAANPRLQALVAQQRFEEAAHVRSRVEAFARVSLKHHRVASIVSCPHVVAAERVADGWEIHVVRYGRLAGAAFCRPDQVPQAIAREAVALAETVPEPVAGQRVATTEETERICDWLERPGVRLIEMEGDWAWPRHAGMSQAGFTEHLMGRRNPPEQHTSEAEQHHDDPED